MIQGTQKRTIILTTTHMYLRVFKVHALRLSPFSCAADEGSAESLHHRRPVPVEAIRGQSPVFRVKGFGVWGSGSEILIDISNLDTDSRQINE